MLFNNNESERYLGYNQFYEYLVAGVLLAIVGIFCTAYDSGCFADFLIFQALFLII